MVASRYGSAQDRTRLIVLGTLSGYPLWTHPYVEHHLRGFNRDFDPLIPCVGYLQEADSCDLGRSWHRPSTRAELLGHLFGPSPV